MFLRILCSCLLFCVISLSTGPKAHGEEVTEAKLKAIFLVNVLGYAEWPGRPKPATYGVCVAASEELSSEVRSYVQLKGLDARIQLRSLDGARNLDGCDVVFVENDTVRGESYILKESREKRILSVGGGDRFIGKGGIIRIYLKDMKLGHLLSSDLLRLPQRGPCHR